MLSEIGLVDGSDFNVFTGVIAAAVTYWLRARRSVAAGTSAKTVFAQTPETVAV